MISRFVNFRALQIKKGQAHRQSLPDLFIDLANHKC